MASQRKISEKRFPDKSGNSSGRPKWPFLLVVSELNGIMGQRPGTAPCTRTPKRGWFQGHCSGAER